MGKNCLTSRSKCYLILGDHESALKDAEDALKEDPKFIKGLFAKAEALYQKGDFEFALVFFHRGRKVCCLGFGVWVVSTHSVFLEGSARASGFSVDCIRPRTVHSSCPLHTLASTRDGRLSCWCLEMPGGHFKFHWAPRHSA